MPEQKWNYSNLLWNWKRKKEKDPDQTVSSLKVKKSGGIAGLPLRAMFLEL